MGWATGCTTLIQTAITLIFGNEICEVQGVAYPVLLAGVLVLVLESLDLRWALVPINVFGTP